MTVEQAGGAYSEPGAGSEKLTLDVRCKMNKEENNRGKMSTPLTVEDQRKLHAEVNQLVNQRFLLNTAAVTLFGVILSWIIPKDSPPNTIGIVHYTACILLFILLFALFSISHLLRVTTRVITTYLIEKDASQWEKDWKLYRSQKSYFAYTKSQTLLFLILGLIVTAFPFLLIQLFNQQVNSDRGLWVVFLVGLLYEIFVFGMGFKDWFYPEKAIQARWKSVLNSQK